MLFLMCFHLTTFANPSLTLFSVSMIKHVCAFLSFADLCGPLFNARSMCSFVQSGPQFAGHPSSLYECKRGAAVWLLAMARGHMSPILPISSSSGMVVGIIVFDFIASCNCFGVLMLFGSSAISFGLVSVLTCTGACILFLFVVFFIIVGLLVIVMSGSNLLIGISCFVLRCFVCVGRIREILS
jgi:hypothetical protein